MFYHQRPIYLQDTDAAGVVYFASIFSICHQAYEASLAAAGVPLVELLRSGPALPVVQAEAHFLQPLRCGDICQVQLVPRSWQTHRFAVNYQVFAKDAARDLPHVERLAATATTQHYCIDPKTRQRQPLPPALQTWYDRWAD